MDFKYDVIVIGAGHAGCVAGFISGFLIVLYVLIHMLIQRKK